MSTWVYDKMGGYYTTIMPTAVDGPTDSAQSYEQDPSTGQWYSCPEYFTIVVCPKCEELPLRCKSDFGFPYRCA